MAFTWGDTELDTIDSREIIERIAELDSLEDEVTEGTILTDEERNELRKLREFAEEASGYAPDWSYGETLIHDSYFTQYCEELVAELYDLEDIPDFILSSIDWEGVADALKVDYNSVDLNGETYWIR